MSLGFTLSVPCLIVAYFSRNFVLMCIFAFAAGFLNCVGNTVFNASMMLALPEQNRSAILGAFRSGSVGGSALSAVIYGFLGEFFPLYIVFAIGSALSLPLMIFMCFHPKIKRFIQSKKTLGGEPVWSWFIIWQNKIVSFYIPQKKHFIRSAFFVWNDVCPCGQVLCFCFSWICEYLISSFLISSGSYLLRVYGVLKSFSKAFRTLIAREYCIFAFSVSPFLRYISPKISNCQTNGRLN